MFIILSREIPCIVRVDITVEEGHKIAVIGANGSGKSTLLHLLDGLFFADKGSVKFLGKNFAENDFQDETFSRNFRRTVGLVFQNPDVQLFCPTVKMISFSALCTWEWVVRKSVSALKNWYIVWISKTCSIDRLTN